MYQKRYRGQPDNLWEEISREELIGRLEGYFRHPEELLPALHEGLTISTSFVDYRYIPPPAEPQPPYNHRKDNVMTHPLTDIYVWTKNRGIVFTRYTPTGELGYTQKAYFPRSESTRARLNRALANAPHRVRFILLSPEMGIHITLLNVGD